jgi:hypothetical protein
MANLGDELSDFWANVWEGGLIGRDLLTGEHNSVLDGDRRRGQMAGDSPFDDAPKDIARKLQEAQLTQIEGQPAVLQAQQQALQEAGGGFAQGLSLEENFLGLAEDFLDPEAQEKRFASVREQLLGDRERTGLFGGTGDEAISIQGLAALDNMRRQDIGFARDLASTSFFNPNRSFGGLSPESSLSGALQTNQFGAQLAFNRRVARDTGQASQAAGAGALVGAGVGGYFGGPQGAAVGSNVGGLAVSSFS